MNGMNNDNTSRQLASQSYKLPIEDQEFLLRDELRGIRFQLEYAKTELFLRDWGIRSTIIVFGSARVPSPEQAELLRAKASTRRPRSGACCWRRTTRRRASSAASCRCRAARSIPRAACETT
jgi:hypothetical protein